MDSYLLNLKSCGNRCKKWSGILINFKDFLVEFNEDEDKNYDINCILLFKKLFEDL